jgi:hypothetical protein
LKLSFTAWTMLDQGKPTDEIIATLTNAANGISVHLLLRKEDPATYARRQIQKAIDERATGNAADGGPDAVAGGGASTRCRAFDLYRGERRGDRGGHREGEGMGRYGV